MMNERMIDTFRMMSLAGKASVLFAIAAILVIVWSCVGLVTTMVGPSFNTQQVSAQDPQDTANYLASIDSDHEFIDRKSSFFKPKAPVAIDEKPETNDTTPPPVHTVYSGPKLMGLSGVTAYFDQPVLNNENNIKIGEEGGTVELIRIIPPFKAVVKWQAKNWTLNLMDTKFSFTTAPEGSAQPLSLRNGGGPGAAPFTNRGSSPNTNVIFGETTTTAPTRRPPRNNR